MDQISSFVGLHVFRSFDAQEKSEAGAETACAGSIGEAINYQLGRLW
jgi:hypothetical protein